MKLTNNEVKAAFARGEAAMSNNLVSTGDKLLSYGWYELARWENGAVVYRSGGLYSMTTKTKHFSGLLSILSQRGVTYKPASQATDWQAAEMLT